MHHGKINDTFYDLCVENNFDADESCSNFTENVVDELEDNLGRVTVITGSLKVSRSFPIVSLDFFKSLREIQGISKYDHDERETQQRRQENQQVRVPAHGPGWTIVPQDR